MTDLYVVNVKVLQIKISVIIFCIIYKLSINIV